MEQRIGGKHVPMAEKKPKDLLRAIGKIDSSDWNVKEIEKKIELSKKATDIGKSRERVPKWNREQFLARQNKLTQQPDDEKYRDIDSSLKAIDRQLKEGHNLDLGERGKNKVASIAGQLLSTKQEQQQQQQQLQQQHQPQSHSKSVRDLVIFNSSKCSPTDRISILDLQGRAGSHFVRRSREVPLLQAARLFDGKDFRRKPDPAQILPQVSPLPYQSSAR